MTFEVDKAIYIYIYGERWDEFGEIFRCSNYICLGIVITFSRIYMKTIILWRLYKFFRITLHFCAIVHFKTSYKCVKIRSLAITMESVAFESLLFEHFVIWTGYLLIIDAFSSAKPVYYYMPLKFSKRTNKIWDVKFYRKQYNTDWSFRYLNSLTKVLGRIISYYFVMHFEVWS